MFDLESDQNTFAFSSTDGCVADGCVADSDSDGCVADLDSDMNLTVTWKFKSQLIMPAKGIQLTVLLWLLGSGQDSDVISTRKLTGRDVQVRRPTSLSTGGSP
jgi:hypothetical protein